MYLVACQDSTNGLVVYFGEPDSRIYLRFKCDRKVEANFQRPETKRGEPGTHSDLHETTKKPKALLDERSLMGPTLFTHSTSRFSLENHWQ